MIIIFLDETECELVIDQQIVYREIKTGEKSLIFFSLDSVLHEKWQLSERYLQSGLPAAFVLRGYNDSMNT